MGLVFDVWEGGLAGWTKHLVGDGWSKTDKRWMMDGCGSKGGSERENADYARELPEKGR